MDNNQVNAEAALEQEQPKESAFLNGWRSFWAFFGFSSKGHYASQKRAKLVGDIVTYIVLLFGAFLMLYPFWWMIAGSFADTSSLGSQNVFNQMVWWPTMSTMNRETQVAGGWFSNYYYLFTTGFTESNGFPTGYSYWRAILNNLIYSIVPVVVGVITSASAAFSFSKINWIGRNAMFMFLLAAIMVPGSSIMITQYVLYSMWGWLKNGLVMIIPGMFGSIMTAFFIRQFLYGLPTSIIEAAKIDGAGYFRIFVSFILPLAMPAIMAQGLLSFMGCWNNYMTSYIFIPANSVAINLPHAMYSLQKNLENNMAPVIAASVLCILPVIILFAAFQKQIISSLMLTGSKE